MNFGHFLIQKYHKAAKEKGAVAHGVAHGGQNWRLLGEEGRKFRGNLKHRIDEVGSAIPSEIPNISHHEPYGIPNIMIMMVYVSY